MVKYKVKSLLSLFLLFLISFAGCKENGNYTERSVFKNPIENKIFVVLGWETIDKTDMVRVFVKEKIFTNANGNSF